MQQRPDRVESIVLACCLLHNLLRTRNPTAQNEMMDTEDPITHDIEQGSWRQCGSLMDVDAPNLGNFSREAREVRDYLVTWVNGAGAVPWQDDKI